MDIFSKIGMVWRGTFFNEGKPATRQRVVSQMDTATGLANFSVPAVTGSIGERQGLPAERISNRQRVREIR